MPKSCADCRKYQKGAKSLQKEKNVAPPIRTPVKSREKLFQTTTAISDIRKEESPSDSGMLRSHVSWIGVSRLSLRCPNQRWWEGLTCEVARLSTGPLVLVVVVGSNIKEIYIPILFPPCLLETDISTWKRLTFLS